MIDLSPATIQSIAARYGLPPTLLNAVLQQPDGVPGSLTKSYGLAGTDDPNQLAEIAARGLVQAYGTSGGSWEAALGQYFTGNPSTAPGAPGSSQAMATLGLAAVNPTMGMQGYAGQANSAMFQSLAHAWQPFADQGGIINDQIISSFTQQANSIGSPQGNGPGTVTSGDPGDVKDSGIDPNLVGGRSYDSGQCTALAAGMLSWVPEYAGDASTWINSVPQKVPGAKVNATPAVGSAAIWQPGQLGAYGAGHVGVVVAINPDGSVQVANQNWPEGQGPNIRTLPAKEAGQLAYIQPPPQYAALSQSQAQMGAKQIAQGQAVNTTTAQAQVGVTNPKPPATGGTGATGATGAAKPKSTSPQQISAFKMQANAAGIQDPSLFNKNLPYLASLSRQLLGRSPTMDEIAETAGMTDQQIRQWVAQQPHPQYPHQTAGELKDAMDKASLASVPTAGRMPYMSEVSRFLAAGFSVNQMSQYYNSSQHPPGMPPPPPGMDPNTGQPGSQPTSSGSTPPGQAPTAPGAPSQTATKKS